MVRETSVWLQWATLLLMAITYFAVEVACQLDGVPSTSGLIFALVVFPTAWIIGRLLMRRTSVSTSSLPRWCTAMLCLLLCGPVLTEPLIRAWTEEGLPLELQLVYGLRNVGIGLAALAFWPICLRLSGIVSLFLMVAVTAMAEHGPIPWFLAAYVAMGVVWLILVYAHRFQQAKSVTTTVTRSQFIKQLGFWLPIREIVVLVSLLVLSASMCWLRSWESGLTLWELMPSSGGTSWLDLRARFGIGDGPEETAGDNAQAAGMVESEKLIEDCKNALIDLISEFYGPPYKPPKDEEKMVAGGQAEIIPFHGRVPDNRRPSRDFSTRRRAKAPKRQLESREARAVFEVRGPTPLHIRQMVFDRYDVENSRWLEEKTPYRRTIKAIGGDWMQVAAVANQAWYCENEKHEFKLAEPNNNLLPTPPLLQCFRIHRVDRAEYYEWAYDGVVAFAGRRRLPPGIIVHSQCRTIDPGRLPQQALWQQFPGQPLASAPLRDVPEPLRAELTRLAEAWAGNAPRGWPQIAVVVQRLRTEYSLDASATAPPNHPAPVLWFLQESRRGPDYMFATAAALLLRALGYATRFCVGYYAAPQAYDPQTGHTPVRTSDLHAWPEVLLSDGQWLVVEPTPGYETLGPRLSWIEQLRLWLISAWRWATEHVWAVSACIGIGGFAVWKYRRLLDFLLTLHWYLIPANSWQAMVLGCLRLIERRCLWVGRRRPSWQTLRAWLSSLPAKPSAEAEQRDRFILIAEQAAYAPHLPVPEPPAQLWLLCRQRLREWNWACLKRWSDTGLKP